MDHHRPQVVRGGAGCPAVGSGCSRDCVQGSAGTHVGDAEEGQEEGGQDDEQCEELPVPVKQLELVGEPGDHGLHAAHLQPGQSGGWGPPAVSPPTCSAGSHMGSRGGGQRAPPARAAPPTRPLETEDRAGVPPSGGELWGQSHTTPPCVATKAQLRPASLSKCLPHGTADFCSQEDWPGHWLCPH